MNRPTDGPHGIDEAFAAAEREGLDACVLSSAAFAEAVKVCRYPIGSDVASWLNGFTVAWHYARELLAKSEVPGA